jgi:LmbE family N-acetylglucosaminyl deacetylase
MNITKRLLNIGNRGGQHLGRAGRHEHIVLDADAAKRTVRFVPSLRKAPGPAIWHHRDCPCVRVAYVHGIQRMKFSQSQADVYVPGGLAAAAALARTTHLCIAAHQDDVEIMAYQGIAECFEREDRWFSGVVVSNGAGSPRTGPYAMISDEEMQAVRRREQRRAARLGAYSIQIQLAHPSAAVKSPVNADVREDLVRILSACRPKVLYVHNPADKHDTHVAVFLRCLEAIRSLPREQRPRQVLGCEVWRDLDWLPDCEKVALDVSDRPQLAKALLGVFKSQIAGGKRYDVATLGRRAAHASYFAPRATDASLALAFAMDLTVLTKIETLDVRTYVRDLIREFRDDVTERLDRLS